MCDDVEAEKPAWQEGVDCSAVTDEGWGLLTTISLPGGSKLGLEPRRPIPPR